MYVWERVRGDLSLFLEGARNPKAVAVELNRLYFQLGRGERYNPDGTDIFEDEDWDNLVLLDACRYDEYAERTSLPGTLEKRSSRGSASKQFVRGNFTGKTLRDTVYVSGNQWYLKLHEELQSELYKYHDVERDAVGGRVPSPETVTSAALEHADRYPHKRLIVHYMQPHRPYLGVGSDQFSEDSEEGRVRLRGIGETIRSGDASWDDLTAAYRDNLRKVLEEVEVLVDHLEGKTVVSADHGELLGDRIRPIPVRWFGHPEAIYVDPLVEVPWHVVSDGPRREIQPGTPETEIEVDPDVDENLRNLGYL